MANTFGQIFRVTTFGESHGPAVGVVIDGVPGNLPIDIQIIQSWLDRRRPGQSHLTSPRDESDRVEILSGIENHKTLGGPITLIVRNSNTRPADYQELNKVFRPGHADFTTLQKYGVTASSGGGRSSARETIGRVAAAAVGWQMIRQLHPNFDVVAWVRSVKDITMKQDSAKQTTDELVTRALVERNPTRCPDLETATKMETLIEDVKAKGDSLGGTIRCAIQGLPAGLGEPVFDKLEADLAKAVMSLPATKGFEIGSGFMGTLMTGSQHNDAFVIKESRIGTRTNNSGGVQGGISNGEIISFNVAFKPVSTIFLVQDTVDRTGAEIKFKPAGGRHDPCVLPRAVPMVEAMATLVIADHVLRHRATAPLIES